MQQNPSLLDWLRVKLGHPRNQRLLRFGLAALAALWGVYSLVFLGKPGVGGFFFLGLAVGLLFWGLSVRGGGPQAPDMPGLSLGTRQRSALAPSVMPAAGSPAAARAPSRESFVRLLAGL